MNEIPDAGTVADDPALSYSPEVASAATADLPMLVWLRGDEEVCAEFILDAEEVMQALGIRRSRLTQISGRELRVGRLRRGRYVSPVYRQVDVDAYRAWTRASASHLKSSGLLQEASGELREQSERLADRLAAVPAAVEGCVQAAIASLNSDQKLLDARIGELIESLASSNEEARQQSQEMFEAQTRNLMRLMTEFGELAEKESRKAIADQAQQLNEFVEASKAQAQAAWEAQAQDLARLAEEVATQHLQLRALTLQVAEVAGVSRLQRGDVASLNNAVVSNHHALLRIMTEATSLLSRPAPDAPAVSVKARQKQALLRRQQGSVLAMRLRRASAQS